MDNPQLANSHLPSVPMGSPRRKGADHTGIYEYESKSQLHTIGATPDLARHSGFAKARNTRPFEVTVRRV